MDAAVSALEDAEDDLAAVKAEIEATYKLSEREAKRDELKAAILDFMLHNDIKERPGSKLKTVVVRPVRGVWNEAKLKVMLTTQQWNLITERKLNPDLLDEAARAGKLDRRKIAKAYEEEHTKPYLRTYALKEDDSEKRQEEADALDAMLPKSKRKGRK